LRTITQPPDITNNPHPRRFVDLTGQRFGRLLAFRCVEINARKEAVWLCGCDCGATARATVARLRAGDTRSCGCLRRIHGHAGKNWSARSPEYRAWRNMRDRARQYGIRVASKWRNSFEAFYRDVGPKPSPEQVLARIDNDLGYFPGYVRWAARSERGR
jgi:Staphylococcus phage HNH endonuclease